MPQALAAALVAAIGATGVAATVLSVVFTLAISVGLNFIAQAVFGSSGVGKPSDGQRTVRVNVGSRIRHYGKVRVGGQLTFYESRNGTLYSLITMGQGRINAITERLLNGNAVSVNSSGTVTNSSFRNAVSIHTKLGTDDQTAHSQLVSAFSEFNSNHRQRGCSNALLISRGVESEEFSEVYEGNREPELTITMESSLVYDPRLDSTQQIGVDQNGAPIMGSGSHRKDSPATHSYSDNWALCFADYLAHPDGYGLGYENVNWENIAQEADVCDEIITTVDFQSVKRWRVAGSYKIAEDERRTVVKEFLKAGDGFMWQDAAGLANIRAGRWINPTVHIDEKHILSVSARLGTDAGDRANEVRVIYMEPNADYTETEASPLIDEVAQARLGRPEVSRFDCYYCPHHNQAQRIGKRILRRLGNRWALTITTNLYGLNVIGQRFISVTVSELMLSQIHFEVTSLQIKPGDGENGMNVTIGLLEVKADDFALDSQTEEGVPPIAGGVAPIAISIEDIIGLTANGSSVSGGIGLRVAWDAPTRAGLVQQVQFKETAASEWAELPVNKDDRVALSSLVNSGVAHKVRARNLSIAGRPSNWVEADITPTAVEQPTAPPSQFSGDEGVPGEAQLSWRNPTESNFEYVRVYRNTSNDFSTATQVGDDVTGALGGVASVTEDGLTTGTYFYWLQGFTASNLPSGETNPITVEVL